MHLLYVAHCDTTGARSARDAARRPPGCSAPPPYRVAFGVAIVAVHIAAVPSPPCHVATAILSAPAAAAGIWLRSVGGLGSPGKLVKRQDPAVARQPSWRTTRPPAASIWSSGASNEAGLRKGVF